MADSEAHKTAKPIVATLTLDLDEFIREVLLGYAHIKWPGVRETINQEYCPGSSYFYANAKYTAIRDDGIPILLVCIMPLGGRDDNIVAEQNKIISRLTNNNIHVYKGELRPA